MLDTAEGVARPPIQIVTEIPNFPNFPDFPNFGNSGKHLPGAQISDIIFPQVARFFLTHKYASPRDISQGIRESPFRKFVGLQLFGGASTDVGVARFNTGRPGPEFQTSSGRKPATF